MYQKAGYCPDMNKDFKSVRGRALTNVVLGTVILSLLFLGVMTLVHLSDQPAPHSVSVWLGRGILYFSAFTLFRVNVLRQPQGGHLTLF